MKNNKVIVILAFIILIPLAWYKLFADSTAMEKEYNNYLKLAREKSEMGITVKADEYYSRALDLHTSYNILVERIQMYWDNNALGKYEELSEDLVDSYPDRKKGYELLAKLYYSEGSYKEVFKLQDLLAKHKKSSDILNEMCTELENEYDYDSGCSYNDAGEFYNGLEVVSNKEGKKGYVNVIGKTAVSCVYEQVSPFNSNGLAGVTDSKGASYIIDTAGNKQYADSKKRNISFIGYISYGYFPVEIDGKYYISDLDFNFTEKSYDFIGVYDGTCAPAYDGEKWFFIDVSGEKISDKTYDDILLDEKNTAFVSERAFVKNGDSYIMIDHKENQVGDEKFENARLFLTEEYAAVKQNNLWGYVDISGSMAIEAAYMDARSFANGYGAVNDLGTWVFINAKEEQKITGDFEDARSFSSNMTAFVIENGKWRIIKLIKYNH